jgi:arylformamidase
VPEPSELKASGQAVWLDMDQRALDDAYDQSKYAPNRSQILARYAGNSDIARERLGAPRRIAYGPTANEALDLYQVAATNAPVSIFVHGGAWRGGLARTNAFVAELFVRAGAHHVVLDFISVVHAGGDLMPMADQVRRRDRLGLPERHDVRWRSKSHPSLRSFVWSAFGRSGDDDGLARSI